MHAALARHSFFPGFFKAAARGRPEPPLILRIAFLVEKRGNDFFPRFSTNIIPP
jgi:hypothetical protein